MAIEGPLKELGIHDVLQLLDLSRKTGRLSVSSKLRHNSGTVYFENGSVVYAEVENNPHLLGGLLVRGGKITEADLTQAREMQLRGDARRLGEILIDIGAITERALDQQVRKQIEEVVFELVGWDEGYFSFSEGDLHDLPTEVRVRIPTESLLMEGARRIDEWSRIERKIPHLGVIPAYAMPPDSGSGGHLELQPSEWEVLVAVDGARDVRGVAEMLARSEFDVAKTIFGLESAGVLDIHEATAPAPDANDETGESLDEIVQRAEQALETGDYDLARNTAQAARASHPHDPLVFLMLGRIDLAQKLGGDAEEQFRRVLRIDPMFLPAHRMLGNAVAMQGKYAEAVEWWQRWLKIGEKTEEDEAELEQVREALRAVEKLDGLLGEVSG